MRKLRQKGIYTLPVWCLVCATAIVMKKLIVLIVILGVLVGGYYGWKNWQKASAASAAPERPTTATVELRSINFAVNAAGEIAPAE